MNLSDISSFFADKLNVLQFKSIISPDVMNYEKALLKIGGSSPVYLTEDLAVLKVGIKDVKRLCENYLIGVLNEHEVNYIAEALLLSDKIVFENDLVEEALLALTDVDYFKNVSSQYIQSILKNISL